MAAAKKTAPKKKAAPAKKKAVAPAKKTAAAPMKPAKKKAAPAAKQKAAPAAKKAAKAAPTKKAAPVKKAPAKKIAKAAPAKKAAPPPPAAPRKTTLRRDKLILTAEPIIERDRLRLLRDGERFGTGQLALHEVGQLALTSGVIVTVDPFLVDGAPLTRKVAPGTYPVTLSVATFNDPKGDHDQRVAAAWVRFRQGQPVRWEVATFAGAPRSKQGGEPGYPVDAGTGAFLDAATQATIQAEPSAWPTPSFKALEKQLLTDNYRHTWGWANYQPDPASPGNCIAFSAGWGDGVFASYWGLDDSGEPVCLLTDFETFTDEDWSV